MFDHYQNTQISQLRREQISREMEMQRLAETHHETEHLPFYAPVLSAIGDALVNAGSNLQTRYSDVREAYEAPRATARPASSTAK
jgi:hypothetical protein